MGQQLLGFVTVAFLLALAAHVARKTRLPSGARVLLSGIALAADLRDLL
jgi:hypothetical protein